METRTTIPCRTPSFYHIVRATHRDWIMRCGTCKSHARIDAGTVAPIVNRQPEIYCCGYPMTGKILKGRVNEHKCGAKCRTSRGHVCECSCGGKNHGTNA
jgi:hypothetical protein